jgi:O-antigen ligase
MDSSPSQHFASRDPLGTSLLRLLKGFFIAALLVVGWGKISIELASPIGLSLGGTTRGLVYLVFSFYVFTRLVRKDFNGFPSLKDPLALYGVLCVFSLFWALKKDFSLFLDNYLPALLSYFMLRYLLENSSLADSILYLRMLVLFAVLIVLRGPADVGGNFYRNPTVMSTSSEHHTIVAMIVLMGIPLAVSLLVKEKPWLYGAALAVMLCGLILANSRIGWFSFFFLFLYLIFAIKPGGIRILLIVAVAGAFALFLFFFPHLHHRFASLFNLMADSDFIARLEIWHYSFLMIKEHPLGGIGFSIPTFIEEGLLYKEGFSFQHPHNGMLTVLVFTGFAGLSLSFWIIGKALRRLFFLARSADPELKPFIIALTGSFLSLSLMNLADSLFNSSRALLMAFLLLAFLFTFSEPSWRKLHGR